MKIPAVILAAVAYVKAHRKAVVTDVTVIAGALGAQPAVHALLHGDKVPAAALIAGVAAAAGNIARRLG